MEMISIDLFHVGHKNFVVIADRFSGYIWVEQLRDLSTKAITKIMNVITSTYGILISCRTDGGPQFRGSFKEYCDEKGIIHEILSPYNPQSNGHAEAAVKTAKHLLIKTTATTFPKALAAWRGTARKDKPRPNELFFGRKIRDKKAIVTNILQKSIQANSSRVPDNSSAKESADSDPSPHKNKHINDFQLGDTVRVRNQATMRWDTKAEVNHVSTSGRTLELTTTEGVKI